MTSQDPQPRTTAYVPRHLAAPAAPTAPTGQVAPAAPTGQVAPARRADLPADPRSMRWDRSAGTLTRVLDELSVLDDGGLSLGSR
ncbi:hypothetical protein EQW78_16570 [Oerskovia turbata]|uniref:Uncharacterized protein n=1 Tax=Oerskovia turbata TaxID=1713 RepID=A0A4Q1KNA2_9CELL|nr:hypothetical protein [Oerskovia turbata]RXR21774.1 hypothetical protein EQW73_17560 [Oerskovia turbata]RXR31428.1 hypothetical protein EQW78_16570 [Oerskovia turbata]